jgi:hypothetical protein
MRRISMKRLILVSIAAGALLLSAQAAAGLMSGSPSKWQNIQVGITYRLYKPGTTLGFKLNKLQSASCGKGHEPWVAATYGTYKGVLSSKTKGFALYEGHPICSNPGESKKIGLLRIMGVWAYVGVYCGPTEHCTGADGVKRGYTVQWKAKPSSPYNKNTQMQLDTSKLTFTQLQKIAKGLKKV